MATGRSHDASRRAVAARGARIGRRAILGMPVTVDQALNYVREHGIVLASAKGKAPRLTEAIAGAPITGSWWAHPHGRRIFNLLQAVTHADDVLVCRLIDGKVTLVHRRLWPLLVRIADRFDPARIARVTEEHLPSGRHRTTEVPFPLWVPADVIDAASAVDVEAALGVLGAWIAPAGPAAARPQRR